MEEVDRSASGRGEKEQVPTKSEDARSLGQKPSKQSVRRTRNSRASRDGMNAAREYRPL